MPETEKIKLETSEDVKIALGLMFDMVTDTHKAMVQEPKRTRGPGKTAKVPKPEPQYRKGCQITILKVMPEERVLHTVEIARLVEERFPGEWKEAQVSQALASLATKGLLTRERKSRYMRATKTGGKT